LEKSQAKVEVAASGTEALHRAREKRFDLILLDIEMPSMDGYSTLAQLRAQGFENPVVACTAHAMKEERLRIQKAGFDGYFTKPIDAGRLATSLSSYL
jgi:CheY-like chemotaxis protein